MTVSYRNSITDYVQRHYWPIYIVSHFIITHAYMDLRFVSFTIHVPLWLWAEQVWVSWQMIRVQEPRCLKNMFCCYKFHLKFHRNIRYFVLFSILVSEACNILCCPVDNNSAPVSGFDNGLCPDEATNLWLHRGTGSVSINSLGHERKDWHFTANIFKDNFAENNLVFTQIASTLSFVLCWQLALVDAIGLALNRRKAIFWPMMTESLALHICVQAAMS